VVGISIPGAPRPLNHTVISDHAFEYDQMGTGFYTNALFGAMRAVEISPERTATVLPVRRTYYREYFDREYPRLIRLPSGFDKPMRIDHLRSVLADESVDVFHDHYPDEVFGYDLSLHQAGVDLLYEKGVPIVATGHNLNHPAKPPLGAAVYQIWSGHTSVMMHHTRYGRDVLLAEREYTRRTEHCIIPHGISDANASAIAQARFRRAECEERLGLLPVPEGGLRISILGWPRQERQTEMAMAAFAANRRKDLRLAVFMPDPKHRPPGDPRIFTSKVPENGESYPYETIVEMAAVTDVFLCPIAEHGMLTTGIASLAVEAAGAALISRWGYLHEYLGTVDRGGAGIPFTDARSLTRRFDELDDEIVEVAAANARSLQTKLSWSIIEPHVLAAYTLAEEIGPVKPGLGPARIVA
jgi:hypothetical protein